MALQKNSLPDTSPHDEDRRLLSRIELAHDRLHSSVSEQEREDLFTQLNMIAKAVMKIKTEIERLDIHDICIHKIPEANLSIEAAVKYSSKAANGIMEIAEELMSLPKDMENATGNETQQKAIEKASMLMEHCTFQDLAGQSLSRAEKILQDVCDRLNHMAETLKIEMTVDPSENMQDKITPLSEPENQPATYGPANDEKNDKRVDQDDIDALFD